MGCAEPCRTWAGLRGPGEKGSQQAGDLDSLDGGETEIVIDSSLVAGRWSLGAGAGAHADAWRDGAV